LTSGTLKVEFRSPAWFAQPGFSFMQAYDIALKLLLQGPARLTMRELTGTAIEKWLDVELPKVQNLRLDLLGRTTGGELIHFELQSSNDGAMALRMIEYALGVRRLFGQFPRQILLYVGEAPMRMENRLDGPDWFFQYRLIDIRSLDGERLMESGDVGDNVIAILARVRDDKEAVHKIMERLGGLARAERETALAQLTILAGLRRLAKTVERETRNMPIDLDIRDHETLGPLFQAERQEGRQEGDIAILRRLIEKRFGALPGWAAEKLAGLSTTELEELSERVLDVRSVEELLR
jgi:hypothetical protein